MKIRDINLRDFSFYSAWKVENMAVAWLLLSAFLVIAYCIWMLDRGFDITDEAYYLLLAMHADSVKVFISAQQWITAGIWYVTKSLVMFRAAGLFLLLSSSVLLAIGVFSTCLRFGLVEDSPVSKVVVIASSVVCALLYASTINFSPSYNLLASSGAYAATGLALLAMNNSGIAYKYALFLLAGFAIGVESLSKPSSGFATLVLLVFWGVVFERSRTNKIFFPVAIIFGAVVCVAIVMLANTTISGATKSVEQGMQLFRMVQVEPIGTRLLRYAIEFREYFLIIAVSFMIPIGAMIGYAITRRSIFVKIGLIVLVVTLLFGSLNPEAPIISMHNLISGSYVLGGFGRYDAQIVAIFAMLVMSLIVSISVWNKNWKTLALFSGLIMLPYSVAIGTGNSLFTQVLGSLAPWGVLIAVLMVARHSGNLGNIPISIISVCFIVTITLQVITSSFRPYHLPSPLVKQDQVVSVGNLGDVKVDAGTYKFLAGINAAVKECGIVPGVPFIGLFNIPGVALPLQAIPVLTPWLNNIEQANFVLDRLHSDELRSAVIAFQMKRDGNFPPMPQKLESFPSGYRYCGEVNYPYKRQIIKIWQSLAR